MTTSDNRPLHTGTLWCIVTSYRLAYIHDYGPTYTKDVVSHSNLLYSPACIGNEAPSLCQRYAQTIHDITVSKQVFLQDMICHGHANVLQEDIVLYDSDSDHGSSVWRRISQPSN